MFCPQCGKEQPDQAKFCGLCGAVLTAREAPAQAAAPEPVQVPEFPKAVQTAGNQTPLWQAAPDLQAGPEQASVPIRAEKKSSKKKFLLISAAALALALVIGVGLWFLLRRNSKKTGPRTVREDMTAASEEVDAYLRQLPNLNRFLENLNAIGQSGGSDYTGEIRVRSGEQDVTERISMQTDYGSRKNRMDLQIGYGGADIGFQMYTDPDQIQIGGEQLFGAGNVYSIPLDNFEERWKNSAIGQMLGSEASLSMFSSSGMSDNISAEKIEAALERLYGQDWITFRDSVKLESCEAADCFAGEGTCYTLVWDSESLGRLGPKAQEALQSQGSLSGLLGSSLGFNLLFASGTSSASLQDEGPDPNELYAHGIVYLLSEVDQSIREKNISNQICKNDKQQVIGLRLADGGEHEILVRLTGAEYPWEHITATYNGREALDFALERTASTLKAVLRVTEEPENAASEVHTAELRYDDDTGRVEFSVDGSEANRIEDGTLELVLQPEGEAVRIRAAYSQEQTSQYFDYSFSTDVELDLTMDRLRGPVEPLSAASRDLLSMSKEEITELINDIRSRASGLFG